MWDHEHITFDLGITRDTSTEMFLKRREILDIELSLETADELDTAAVYLQNAIIKSYEARCPEKRKVVNNDVPYWNKEVV